MWSPRGIHGLSTDRCTGVNNPVNPVEQLEEYSRMNGGQIPNLHRRLRFILESPAGHPHGTTPCDLGKPVQSTDSTAPTTTSVLLIRDLFSKQGVWKSPSGPSAAESVATKARRRAVPRHARIRPRRPDSGSDYDLATYAGTVWCRSPMQDFRKQAIQHFPTRTTLTSRHGSRNWERTFGRWSLQA